MYYGLFSHLPERCSKFVIFFLLLCLFSYIRFQKPVVSHQLNQLTVKQNIHELEVRTVIYSIF